MRTAKDWIKRLEAEECPDPLHRELLRRLRESHSTRDLRIGNHSDPKPFRDSVSHLLATLWVDIKFWELIGGKPKVAEIQKYVNKNFGLFLPPFSYQVYVELVHAPALRDLLFQILRSKPGTLVAGRPSNEAQTAIEEWRSRGVGELLVEYLNRELLSRRSLLRWWQLSDSTLKQIKAAAGRLIKDVDWCLKNPTIKKPQPALFRGRGQARSPEDVDVIEKMVEMWRNDPKTTIGQVAMKYTRNVVGSRVETSKEVQPAIRHAASDARRLAELREGIRVFHYVDDKGFGRKPRRKI